MQNHEFGNNLRRLRKEANMTQDALAEAMGVSIGAVSKWERGAAIPELGVLIELAALFEVSLDTLAGYQMQSTTKSAILDRLKACRRTHDFASCRVEAERALQKFPNSFEIVYHCAVSYMLLGISGGVATDPDLLQRALALFQQSLVLLGQNTDPEINEQLIQHNIAQLHLMLGQTDRALELLIKTNADSSNASLIGHILASFQHKPEEAFPYLSDALVGAFNELSRVCIAFANAYSYQERHAESIQVLSWELAFEQSLRRTDAICYFDRSEVMLRAGIAVGQYALGDLESARTSLRLAIEAARRFDNAPNYSTSCFRFYAREPASTIYDSFGTTALDGLADILRENAESHSPGLLALYEEVLFESCS